MESFGDTDQKFVPTKNLEFSDWAQDLLRRPIPQVLNWQQDSGNEKPYFIPPHEGFESDSAIGKFTWQRIGEDKLVPCLYRDGVKYCCVRMIQYSVTGELQNCLPQDIYDAAKLRCRTVTSVEARLLTYINVWHCDGFYGRDAFTEMDLILPVKDLEEFYSYLTFAKNVLSNQGQNTDFDFSRCGYARIANNCLVPYTVLSGMNGENGVPLFYFEGPTTVLETKTQLLSGWDLVYLKFCCKLQGVKDEYIVGDSVKIVKLSDVKSHFPAKTGFTEQCWLTSKDIRYPALKTPKVQRT